MNELAELRLEFEIWLEEKGYNIKDFNEMSNEQQEMIIDDFDRERGLI